MRDLYITKEDKLPTEIRCLGFSPDGRFLATVDKDGEIKVSFYNVNYLLDLISPDMDSLPKVG